jgi:hypothetical protein
VQHVALGMFDRREVLAALLAGAGQGQQQQLALLCTDDADLWQEMLQVRPDMSSHHHAASAVQHMPLSRGDILSAMLLTAHAVSHRSWRRRVMGTANL